MFFGMWSSLIWSTSSKVGNKKKKWGIRGDGKLSVIFHPQLKIVHKKLKYRNFCEHMLEIRSHIC